MKNEYRIINDRLFDKYYVYQIKRWWWPFWIEPMCARLCPTIEEAEESARRHANPTVKKLGKLP